MKRLKTRIISYIMIVSVCVSLWSPVASNQVLAEGNANSAALENTENSVSYELELQNNDGTEVTSLNTSDDGELDLYSLLKVMKIEGETKTPVETIEKAQFKYASSKANIATVSEDGVVMVKDGSTEQTVDITVYWTGASESDSATNAPTATRTFSINVTPLTIKEINLSTETLCLNIGKTYDLLKDVNILPAGAPKELTYQSEDEEVVSVSQEGLLTVKMEGTTKITVSSTANPDIYATITVTVIDAPVSLELNQTAYSMKAAEDFQLSAYVVYESGRKKQVDASELTFKTENKQVVTVDNSGKVTGLIQSNYPATENVTVLHSAKYNVNGNTLVEELSAQCQITITKTPVEKVVIENKAENHTFKIKDTFTLKVNVLPNTATDKTVNFKSSNTNVATVNSSGVITATGIGEATITVTTPENSAVEDTFVVKVYQTTFDIVELGVNGKDKSNDATKINKILKYAFLIDEPVTVIIPDGTYYLSSTLKVYDGTTIVLSDNALVKRAESAGGVHMLMNYTDSDVKGYNQCSDITITGGAWDGDATGAHDADCFYFGHAKNITITNTTIMNNSGAHLIEFAGVQNALVENVELYGYTMCTEKGYTATQSEKEAIQIDYCSSVSAPAMTPYDGTACDNITIRNCKIHDYMAGIGTHTKGVNPSTNIRIENNTFENITNACINLPNFSNVTINNNTAKNCTTFVYASGSQGIISNNTVTNGISYTPVTTSGLRAKNGITISNGSNFTIQNNTFEKAKSNGICVWNKSTAVIQNNKIKNNKLYGIRTQGSTITLKKNSFSKNTKGIYDTYKDAKVKSSDDIRAYYIDIKKSYKYKGKAVKPKIKIKGLSKKYYKVSYKNYKRPGTATVKIKGKRKVKQTLKIKYKITR